MRKLSIVLIMVFYNTTLASAFDNAYDAYWKSYNNVTNAQRRIEESQNQRRQLQIEEERLRIQREQHRLILNRDNEEQAAKNKKTEILTHDRYQESETWKKFIKNHPEFENQHSRYRKYGDYLFDTNYSRKVHYGEITYAEALNKIANEAHQTLGKPSDIQEQ